MLLDQLTGDQVRALHANNQTTARKIVPDMVVDFSEDLEAFANTDVSDTRAIIDMKTIGFSRDYLTSSRRSHHSYRGVKSRGPCRGANDRATAVKKDYREKAARCDRALGFERGVVGPVQARLRCFALFGLAVGPFGEISAEWRKILKPAIQRVAERRRPGMVIHNLTQEQAEAAIYDAIRRRIGMMAHSRWYDILLHSLKLAHRSMEEEPEAFEVGNAVDAAAPEVRIRANGELGV